MHLIHPLGGTFADETSLLPSMAAAITSPRAAVSTAEQELDKSELDKMTDLSFCFFFFFFLTQRRNKPSSSCLTGEVKCSHAYQHQHALLYGLRTQRRQQAHTSIHSITRMNSCSGALFHELNGHMCKERGKHGAAEPLVYLWCTTMTFITVKFQPLGTLQDGLWPGCDHSGE